MNKSYCHLYKTVCIISWHHRHVPFEETRNHNHQHKLQWMSVNNRDISPHQLILIMTLKPVRQHRSPLTPHGDTRRPNRISTTLIVRCLKTAPAAARAAEAAAPASAWWAWWWAKCWRPSASAASDCWPWRRWWCPPWRWCCPSSSGWRSWCIRAATKAATTSSTPRPTVTTTTGGSERWTGWLTVGGRATRSDR